MTAYDKRTIKKLAPRLALLLCGHCLAAERSSVVIPPTGKAVVTDSKLRAQAIQETSTPVRPGVPGEQPFWNGQAVQFLYAPAFDFKEVPGAKSYRFTVAPVKGETFSFTADKPWAPLSPIWTKVPTGKETLTVLGLDAQGAPVGEPMTRTFHRAAVIGKEYPAPAMPWRESARTALDALVHSGDLRCWFTTGEPDPEVYLYRYPAKIIGAAAAALATYASQTPPPADAAEAMKAARRAADYLLGLSYPADSAWAFHPPTYHPTMYRDKLKGHMVADHHMTQYGAVAGQYYLDVYAATQNAKYLEAAMRIAETYARRQLPEGSWLLFVTAQDGKPVEENVLIPTQVVEFLDRLGQVSGDHRFDAMCEKAIAWIERNPARTWNWQGQFEDVKPQPPYLNLTKHDACTFAIHLFQTAPHDQAQRTLALDLLRFAEDQFVIWAQPPLDVPAKPSPDGAANAKSAGWMLPCVLEQYRCYAPVCASSAKLIRTYLAAYGATGDRLHLEKAKALAATLTRTQSSPQASGRYLTWVKKPSGPMWFNCELAAIRAMIELADCADAPISGEAGSAAAPDKPNIVFILADDLGWADVSFHGTEIKTPNIDRLAAAGARLESFYALPVCTPSRSALMTGRYPIRYGRQYNVLRPGSKVGLSLDERLLPQALQEAGYETAMCGKWHLGEFQPAYQPMQRGFDHQYRLAEPDKRFSHLVTADNSMIRDRTVCSDKGYLTPLFAAEAVRMIEQRDADRPLFLYVAFHSPHTPVLCPPEYSAPYADLGPSRSVYAGMVAQMDEAVGQIVAAVERQGMRSNTLFIFGSDNGGLTTKGDLASNGPLRAGKGSLYEGGTRVVACVAWDGHIPAGSVVTEPLHMVDWYPTLLTLAGASLTQPLPLDGRDAWPTITQGKPSPHDMILLNTVGREGAVRKGDWKFVRDGKIDDDEEGGVKLTKEEKQKKRQESRNAPATYELFNLAQDPFEKTNLADQYPEKVRELCDRLEIFAQEAVPPITK